MYVAVSNNTQTLKDNPNGIQKINYLSKKYRRQSDSIISLDHNVSVQTH